MPGGKFITFEGGDGTGKSTQIALFLEYLQREGIEYIFTREPGGTAISERIRQILLDPACGEMADMTEVLLYAAARAQLARELILPARNDGKLVVCDRWVDSSIVYQGMAKEMMDLLAGQEEAVRVVNGFATVGMEPDVTILLDLDPAEALGRAQGPDGSLDRIESRGEDYHRAVRESYLALAEQEARIRVVDAAGSAEAVHARVLAAVLSATELVS
ncbi:thymidylate kinase [Clostridia bacterium]|nr:thymidylate kinase [Clostridia bacterium]